ncbi:MAG: preprotein translocase subunit SecE [Gemmatimonadales bacterium]|uniref:preprotein translocase subunit SecE n=1 Tax=Candidatus Palauibacter TaxID=3056650 RepID=UPI001382075C|nr:MULTISPECIES: preprotein translocase subunit SecE [Palauibacter]MCY3677753.1 preprotein translocase subunit SecE [Gemmatimonadota bacterium]MCZ0936743.1 preprotein translocase subunit SecE [Candidatus Palauibacter rhopaloidicola]MXX68754.1 preprotein translocase subunit SecE [Gemmatimonadales bacterium]MDE2663323.1 preprotein translocase subunit SecE [Candidatus Palauibacter scopulicola]MDE2720057.1 preprotein translocase subunit SecE [Candidatus Palauibacter polyketidifaciens]
MAGIVRRTQEFAEQVQVEMRRVTWPDKDQLRGATIGILIFVFIMAIVIGAMDSVFAAAVRFIVRSFGG